MLKSEFLRLINTEPPTDDEYELIEKVYNWHPAISETDGKRQVARLWDDFRITIFYDMSHRADAILQIQKALSRSRTEVEKLKEVQQNLQHGYMNPDADIEELIDDIRTGYGDTSSVLIL